MNWCRYSHLVFLLPDDANYSYSSLLPFVRDTTQSSYHNEAFLIKQPMKTIWILDFGFWMTRLLRVVSLAHLDDLQIETGWRM